MPSSFPGELLLLTDGTTTVDLMNRAGGMCVQSWIPAVAEAKGGGAFRDSPLAEGRTLAYRQLGNVIDSFQILVDDPTQDGVAREVKKLRDLLESAVKYWVSRQPGKFVYLVARAPGETNVRYATVIDYRTPSDADPYDDPYAKLTSPRAAFDPWTLTVEHDQWGEAIPGTSTCVELSAEQEDWNPVTAWYLESNQPVDNVNALFRSSAGWRFIGDIGQIWRAILAGGFNPYAAVALAHANCLIYSMALASDGLIYASGYDAVGLTGYTYSANTLGAAWNTYGGGTNRGSNNRTSLFAAADDLLYLSTGSTLAAPRPLLSTIPGSDAWVVATSSTQWAEVLCCSEFPSTSLYAPNRMVLSVYDTLGNGVIYTSDDYWATESKRFELSGVRFITLFITSFGTMLAGTDTGAIYASVNGEDWSLRRDGLNDDVYQFAEPDDIYAVADGILWISGDGGLTWTHTDTVTAASSTIYSFLYVTEQLQWAGIAGDVYLAGGTSTPKDLGASATCDDKPFAVNHRGEYNLSHVMTLDAPAAYSNWMGGTAIAWPAGLFPAVPVINDAVYFGIDTDLQLQGDPVFDNIVFNISTPAFDMSLRWEYYGSSGWTALTCHDGTDAGGGPFTRNGINSVSFEPPADWTTTAINGTTALWVRCLAYAAPGGAAVSPEQDDTYPYSCIWPRTDIAAAQVPGTLMALARHQLTMRSDADGLGSDSPDLYANRVLMGLRSIERGGVDCTDFTAYLNCSDEQNPAGINCAVGSSTSFVNYLDHATGRVAEYYPMGNQPMALRVRFEMAGDLARQYYGSYRVFARVRETGRVYGTINMRLYVGSPWGADEYWSTIRTIPTTEGLNKLIDFGEITLPLARVLTPGEYPGTTRLELHASCSDSAAAISHTLGTWMSNRILAPYDTGIESSVNPTDLSHWTTAQLAFDGITSFTNSPALYFLDVILLPTDEWHGDFVDDVLSTTTALQQGYYFDLDSISNPRERQRPLVMNAATGAVMTVYEAQSPGPALLNPNTQQRMWYLFDKSIATSDGDWDSSAHILVSARAKRMARYLGMRGDQ